MTPSEIELELRDEGAPHRPELTPDDNTCVLETPVAALGADSDVITTQPQLQTSTQQQLQTSTQQQLQTSTQQQQQQQQQQQHTEGRLDMDIEHLHIYVSR